MPRPTRLHLPRRTLAPPAPHFESPYHRWELSIVLLRLIIYSNRAGSKLPLARLLTHSPQAVCILFLFFTQRLWSFTLHNRSYVHRILNRITICCAYSSVTGGAIKGVGVYSAQERACVGGRGDFGRLEARWDPFSKFNTKNFYRGRDKKVSVWYINPTQYAM
jgi:hypothetical protein